MTTEKPDSAAPAEDEHPEYTAADVRWARVQRKQARIRAEIERNRAGDHKVPTWALAALLGLVILAWVILVIAS
ncbi:hypothetical protein HH310_20250 [Actinoplanes sp. TBRC 11911]|uniref:hypothetical protein n=1 Tax=Actinoplanes sp. TBRC 11911 TaxID=2729386 RepID=UPI00145DA738|nr:hypothetical protein [Actinoplanes sp. TBRC 11911]NMO53504.1 hypothetical protein [Actinoplanes sp. TBRC 11911]